MKQSDIFTTIQSIYKSNVNVEDAVMALLAGCLIFVFVIGVYQFIIWAAADINRFVISLLAIFSWFTGTKIIGYLNRKTFPSLYRK